MIFLARWRKIMRWKVGRGRWSPTPTPMEINIRQKLVLKLVFRNWAVHTAHTRTHHALYRRTKLTAKIYFTETNSHWMFAPSISTANERYEEQISENRIHAKPATSVRKHQLHRNPNILRVISLGINFCRSMEFLGDVRDSNTTRITLTHPSDLVSSTPYCRTVSSIRNSRISNKRQWKKKTKWILRLLCEFVIFSPLISIRTRH